MKITSLSFYTYTNVENSCVCKENYNYHSKWDKFLVHPKSFLFVGLYNAVDVFPEGFAYRNLYTADTDKIPFDHGNPGDSHQKRFVNTYERSGRQFFFNRLK